MHYDSSTRAGGSPPQPSLYSCSNHGRLLANRRVLNKNVDRQKALRPANCRRHLHVHGSSLASPFFELSMNLFFINSLEVDKGDNNNTYPNNNRQRNCNRYLRVSLISTTNNQSDLKIIVATQMSKEMTTCYTTRWQLKTSLPYTITQCRYWS